MADLDNPDNVLSATFPAPPPFWKHFTSDNRARYRELQQQNDDQTAAGEGEGRKPADIPAELRYLRPPEPPATGKYRSFGDPYDINTALTSLRAMGVEQLYPSPPSPSPSPTSPSPSPSSRPQQQQQQQDTTTPTTTQWTLDRSSHIKQMTQSLLLNYLEMAGVLAADPGRWQDKYEDMQTLLFNAHHLINEYRPHQARASLIAMMEEQLARRREEVEGGAVMRALDEELMADGA
ncbi:Mediator of RNA polymerase II transcription subunit 7 [Diplodia intermedia]|uniref:Mediator of RNA polymerase II transcription subunit 7 n=1 Tax=Diplodia intermedia TaxID=856260 RepID=A0ABR3U2P8_9PEZI